MIRGIIAISRALGRQAPRRQWLPAGALALVAGLLTGQPAAAAQININIAEELDCLALNIYHEARGEPELGKLAVGHVTLNRVADARFPMTVCGVVRQGGEAKLHRCQFSWWCDGRSDRPRDTEAWQAVRAVARKVYLGFSVDPTEGALWYHADSVLPSWGKVLTRGPQIGQHLFYLPDDPAAQQTSQLTLD